MKSCCFCFTADSSARQVWDRPFFESRNFFAIPSLGALVEGWVLLVPRKHVVCSGALEPSLLPEFAEVKERLSNLLRERYGTISIFEHGPSVAGHDVGCTVDHAHLHFVPLSFDLGEAAQHFLPSGTTWKPATHADCRRAYREGTDYLYLESPLKSPRIVESNELGSQVLRRAIAQRVGRAAEFDWRKFRQLDTVAATVTALSAIG